MTDPSCASQPLARTRSCAFLFSFFLALIAYKACAFFLLGRAHLIWDSHWYLALAENLAANGDYTLGDGIFHAKYPPGFPLLIAALGKVLGNFESAAAALVWLSSCSLCYVTYILGCRASACENRPCTSCGIVAATLYAAHHLSIIHSNLILTEQIFALGALTSLLIATRAHRGTFDVAYAVLLAGVASLIRYEGLLLFPVLIGCWVRARPESPARYRLPLLLSGLAVIALWAIWFYALMRHGAPPLGGLYGQELSRFSVLAAVDFTILGVWLGPCFLVLACAGAIRFFGRKNHNALPFAAFALLYFACHLAWWFSDIRFYIVLLPLIAATAAPAIVEIANRLSRGNPFGSRILICAILLLCAAEQFEMFKAKSYEYRQYNSLYLRQYDLIEEASAWANAHLPQEKFGVPEVSIYGRYLPPARVFSYHELPEIVLQRSGGVFLIIDNMHFKNPDIQSALQGVVTVRPPSGPPLQLPAKVLYKAEARLTPDDERYAAVVEILDP